MKKSLQMVEIYETPRTAGVNERRRRHVFRGAREHTAPLRRWRGVDGGVVYVLVRRVGKANEYYKAGNRFFYYRRHRERGRGRGGTQTRLT